MKAEDYFLKPWMLVQNQIRSAGGYAMDIFRGRPETKGYSKRLGGVGWLGNTCKRSDGRAPNFGCAEVVLPDGTNITLLTLLTAHPWKSSVQSILKNTETI